MEKINLTLQKHTSTNQKKCTTTQNIHKKLKPGLVASYNIQTGNGEGLFWFQCFTNLKCKKNLLQLTSKDLCLGCSLTCSNSGNHEKLMKQKLSTSKAVVTAQTYTQLL